MNQIIVQGVGYLALLFSILSFQKNKRIAILLFMLVSLLLYVVHYFLLNARTGALMNLIEAGVVFVAYQKETKAWAQHKFWPYLFSFCFIIAGILTSKTYMGSLPVIAQIFGTVAVWQNNSRAIRFIMLVPRPLWFIYNFTVGSYAGMAAEVFIFLSVVVGIVRFDILKKTVKQAK